VARDFQQDARYERGRLLAKVVNERYRDAYVRDSNIIGSAYGRRITGGQVTDEPAVVVYVVRKVSEGFLPPSRLLPRRAYVGHDWIDVDVVETGTHLPAVVHGS
jgi:hypothetical protein